MELELALKGEAKVNMPMVWIIEELNSLPFDERWNYVKELFREILLSDVQDLSKKQWINLNETLLRYHEALQNYKPDK